MGGVGVQTKAAIRLDQGVKIPGLSMTPKSEQGRSLVHLWNVSVLSIPAHTVKFCCFLLF